MADLLKGLNAKAEPAPEGKLNNPDLPEGKQRSASNREATRDMFYRSMKQTTMARNGSGYSMARTGGLPNLNPRRQSFLLEGAIDPANIRARTDPLRAPPNSYAQGAEGFLYQLPASTREAHTSIELMQKARQSYANRINRLQPISVPVSLVGGGGPAPVL